MADPSFHSKWQSVCTFERTAIALLHLGLMIITIVALVLYSSFMQSTFRDIASEAHVLQDHVYGFEYAVPIVCGLTILFVVYGLPAIYRQQRLVIAIYGVMLLILLGGYVYLAIISLDIRSVTSDWTNVKYTTARESDLTKDEKNLAKAFNTAYCRAQRATLCDSMTIQDLLDFGIDNITMPESSSDDNGNTSTSGSYLNAACNDTSHANSSIWKPLCHICHEKVKYDDYVSLARWSKDHCSNTRATITWCSVDHSSPNNESITNTNASNASSESADLPSDTTPMTSVPSPSDPNDQAPASGDTNEWAPESIPSDPNNQAPSPADTTEWSPEPSPADPSQQVPTTEAPVGVRARRVLQDTSEDAMQEVDPYAKCRTSLANGLSKWTVIFGVLWCCAAGIIAILVCIVSVLLRPAPTFTAVDVDELDASYFNNYDKN